MSSVFIPVWERASTDGRNAAGELYMFLSGRSGEPTVIAFYGIDAAERWLMQHDQRQSLALMASAQHFDSVEEAAAHLAKFPFPIDIAK